MKQNTGARGLRAIIEKIMLDLMFDIPSNNKEIKRIIIDKDVIENNMPPRIIKRDKEKTA